MNHFNPESSIVPRVLATDLDGTLIPLPETEANITDLQRITDHFSRSSQPLVFATGRHFESVLDAIEQYNLPIPEWIVCDVGSAIYQRVGSRFEVFEKYEAHLTESSGGFDRALIERPCTVLRGLSCSHPRTSSALKSVIRRAPRAFWAWLIGLMIYCERPSCPTSAWAVSIRFRIADFWT